MKIKYLVICVDECQHVCSVDAFDTEQAANAFLAEDAAQVYADTDESTSSIVVRPGYAYVVDGEETFRWSIYPLQVS